MKFPMPVQFLLSVPGAPGAPGAPQPLDGTCHASPLLAQPWRRGSPSCYSSMSFASSSEKSDMEDSEEDRSSLSVSLRASSVANFFTYSATFFLYSSGLWRYIAAASPFNGSVGFGYVRSCGRKDSNMLERS